MLYSIPGKIPDEVRAVIRDSEIYDSSCSPQARVYFANAEGGCYVKRADKGTLEREALMNKYFHFSLYIAKNP